MFAMNDLKGRVAVVTGSTSGIGLAFARAVALCGGDVVLNGLGDADAIEKTRADLAAETGVRVLYHPADMTQPDQIEDMIATAQRELGRLDILVNNAATNPYFGPMAKIEDDAFRKILDNNIVANHWLISEVVPQMIERKDGSITIVSSIGGLKGSTVIGAYCISKAADMQLARNLACEYGKHNVRVNCIAPGLIKTDFAKALWEDQEMLTRRTATTPLRRIGEPHEIAGAVAFLGSDASTFMTGQTIVIDGGVTTAAV